MDPAFVVEAVQQCSDDPSQGRPATEALNRSWRCTSTDSTCSWTRMAAAVYLEVVLLTLNRPRIPHQFRCWLRNTGSQCIVNRLKARALLECVQSIRCSCSCQISVKFQGSGDWHGGSCWCSNRFFAAGGLEPKSVKIETLRAPTTSSILSFLSILRVIFMATRSDRHS